ncbi:MAG: hypothetical protein M3314_01805, partial [Actinomycetota bacterium]|nr:hypothetical protein [Actinomycetota bacterium]
VVGRSALVENVRGRDDRETIDHDDARGVESVDDGAVSPSWAHAFALQSEWHFAPSERKSRASRKASIISPAVSRAADQSSAR